mgnify:CR=1 FL=1
MELLIVLAILFVCLTMIFISVVFAMTILNLNGVSKLNLNPLKTPDADNVDYDNELNRPNYYNRSVPIADFRPNMKEPVTVNFDTKDEYDEKEN